MNTTVSIDFQYPRAGYAIEIGRDLLPSSGEWLKRCVVGKAGKVVLVSNARVFGLYGEVVKNSLSNSGLDVFVCLIGDGEKYKSFKTLQKTLNFLGENNISRTDAIIALGGGVVGDLAGFAASVYLRGIPFLQIPTTLLAMIDSSVGGKTAVNSAFGKNLIGSFYQPSGVLIDVNVLQTLPTRELTAGFCEAVKQGAISGRQLLMQTASFLEKHSSKNFGERYHDNDFLTELVELVAAQITFKAEIVNGDEKESPAKTDARSRKILNFGHTLAHALEKATDYRYLKHGEAVGYGIMFAAELSKNVGLLDRKDVNLLNDVVHRAGKLPPIKHLDPDLVFDSFKYDKKTINDSLQWVLLKGIGKPVIVSHTEIPTSAMQAAFSCILRS